ncbi:MAG TPA: ATP-binding cassette domain-containing protein [Steroidobacteraceae bacterium]|nr:ATP-binding cassette domain-containing protein [Steroidobacteraceae bacterium]
MLVFDHLSLRRGTRLLLNDVSFTVHRNEKVGLVGANGTGKSSLLALVRGELHADAGDFSMPARLSIAHVAQELPGSERAAIEFVLDGDAELRAVEADMQAAEAQDAGARLAELHARYAGIGGYEARSRAARLMHGLGFEPADETRPLNAFSGGWRVRINLAQALMCRSDLLLLDEPTNHLDLDAVVWLEGWLLEYPGTLLVIAHDRDFLDRVVNRVVHLENGKATPYSGNYSEFEVQRAAQLAQQSALYERQQREIKHMVSFVERFRAKASKARQAQSRLKALERMEQIAPAHVDSPFEFSFRAPLKLPQPLLALEEQSVGYGERVVLDKINLTINPGDRIALLGRNGAGKSTLVKLLAGDIESRGGKRTDARDLRIGYFAQHQLEQLHPQQSPLEHVRDVEAELGQRAAEQELRTFLGGFGFVGDRVFEPVGPFSGGEKARVALALVSFRRPNLLLLDEPTNHLDLDMRQALAVALQDYDGAVVLVAHDRHMLRSVADTLLLVANQRVREFEGDLDDYARLLAAPAQEEEAEESPSGQAAKRQRKREEAEKRNRLSPLRQRIRTLEREMEGLQKQLTQLEHTLADAALYMPERRAELQQAMAAQREATAQLRDKENAWLEASEELEREES